MTGTGILLYIAVTKAKGHDVYVTSIKQRGNKVELKMYEKAWLDGARIPELITKYEGKLKFVTGKGYGFEYTLGERGRNTALKPMEVINSLLALFEDMNGIKLEKPQDTENENIEGKQDEKE